MQVLHLLAESSWYRAIGAPNDGDLCEPTGPEHVGTPAGLNPYVSHCKHRLLVMNLLLFIQIEGSFNYKPDKVITLDWMGGLDLSSSLTV